MKKYKAQYGNKIQAMIMARLRFAVRCVLFFCTSLLTTTARAQYNGGPYVGGVFIQSNCPARPPLPDTGKVAYTGGSHSGFSSAVVSCPQASQVLLTDIYTGGPHEGFSLASVSCPAGSELLLTNIYTGGIHAGGASLAVTCSVPGEIALTNIYTGGSYDGDASSVVSCPLSHSTALTDIYTGGSFTGSVFKAISCPPSAPMPDTGKVAYTGGAHSGFASAVVSCPATLSPANIFKGASYQGFSVASISCLATASAMLTNIFKGASYQGFTMADISCATATGSETLTNIYTGGPHAGFNMSYLSCPTEPLFVDSITVQNVVCNGECTGTAASNPVNGTPPYTYYWNTNPAQTTHTVTGLCAGTYSVTVTDAAFNTATATHNITQPSPISITVSVINAACDTANGQALAIPLGGTPPYSYKWSNLPSPTTQRDTGLSAGNYTVTVSDSSNCSATAIAVISGTGGNMIAAVNITASSTTICAGTPVTFTAVPANGGLTPFYQWQVNGLNAGANSTIFTDDSLNNNDRVTCIMTSDAACVTGSPATANTISITVTQHPEAGTIVPDKDTICEGSSGSLDVAGATGNVQWQTSATDNNFSNIPGANSDSYNTPDLSQPAYYRVYLSGGTCSDTSAVLELMVSPEPDTPALTATDTAICPNDSTLLCAPNTFSSYLWNTGAVTPCIYTGRAGAYWVSVTSSGGCSITSTHLNINLNRAPNASISQHIDTLTCTNAVSYQWYFNDSILPGAVGQIYIALQTGNYTVQITDSNGCVATSKIFPYVFNGVKDLPGSGRLEIYPNPVTAGWFNLYYFGTAGKSYHLIILNSIGQKIGEEILNFSAGKTIPVNVSQLAKGVYLLQLQSGDQSVMQKIVIQ